MVRESREATTETVEESATEPENGPEAASDIPASPLSEGQTAFYKGEYDTAIAHFDAALKESSYDGDSRAKAAYWRAEACLQREFTRDKIALFESVVLEFPAHYLGSAAKRRVEALRLHFAAFEKE